jgi:glycosyltransferase 2 family protein
VHSGAAGRARLFNLLTALVTLLAVLFLAGAIADVPSAFAHVYGEDWLWLVPAVGFAIAGYWASAVSLAGAVDFPLPLARTTTLEIGEAFTTMATPGGVGSFALTVRFLQQRGMDLAPASASAALASVASALVDLVALVVGVALSASAFDAENIRGSASSKGWLVLAVVIGLAAAVAIVWHFPRLRNRVVPQLRKAAALLRAVLRKPRKAALLFSGQLLSLAATVLCLYSTLQLVHLHTDIAVLVAVTMLANTAQRAVPIPGALGAPEAILVAGLTGAGLASTPVVAAALTYRMFTYWLPAIPGFFFIRHLRHRGDV